MREEVFFRQLQSRDFFRIACKHERLFFVMDSALIAPDKVSANLWLHPLEGVLSR